MVRDTIKQSLDYFNVSSLIEYRPLAYSTDEKGKQKRIRPDGKTPQLDALWDVAITTPTCKSYIDMRSDAVSMVAAKVNESAKRNKYDALAASEGLKFYPLVFESFGGFGKGATDFIIHAADSAVDVAGGGLVDRSQIIDYVRSNIAFAIVKGNAAVIRNAIRLAAKGRTSAPPLVVRPVVRGMRGPPHSRRS